MVDGRLETLQTITYRVGVECSRHRISACETHEKAHRHYHQVENHAQHNPRIDPSQDLAELAPTRVYGLQQRWPKQRRSRQQGAENPRPEREAVASEPGKEKAEEQGEETARNQAEITQLFSADCFLIYGMHSISQARIPVSTSHSACLSAARAWPANNVRAPGNRSLCA